MTYAGGIVFDLDSTGQHGLVCAPTDQGNYEWGCYRNMSIPNTSISIGTGSSNTINIVSGCLQRPIAASVCSDLVLNGYSDWFLPSQGELQLMYSRLDSQGLGGFNTWGWYWSSTQNPIDGDSALCMDFNVGMLQYARKDTGLFVRAVRVF
jgi:hypothetical protein